MKYIKAKYSIKRKQGACFFSAKIKPPVFLIKFRGSRQRFFFSTEPNKHQNSALALSELLGNLSRLFSPRLTLQTSIPTFAFSARFYSPCRACFIQIKFAS